MEINEFIANFADQFDDTPAEDLTPATVFHDLDEYSSIIALSIIAMIDEEYGVALTGNEMKSAVTIQDLFDTVQAKVA
jgi:acyl carrier protein